MAKKYYWLKLKNDFFKRHDVRIVEAMPNGKDYVLFYLKLLVESVSHDGHLRFSETIPYNEEMLATITNTNIDIVRSAIKIFTELNLMETLDDNTIYMLEVEKMTGSESEWAEKKRLYREKKRTLSLKSPNGVLQEKEKEIDKELERETEVANLLQLYQNDIQQTPAKTVMDLIIYWYDQLGYELLEEAIKRTAKKGVRNFAYIESILKSWSDQGVEKVADIEELDKNRNNDEFKVVDF